MIVSNNGASTTATPVASTSTSTAQSLANVPFVPGGQLGKNSFLQLLATQMQYQDPLQPQDNSQFVAQLAQFSSLEQMTNVATEDGQVATGIGQLQSTVGLSSAFSLLGNTVSLQAADGSTVSGVVNSVTNQSGQVMISVGGTLYPVSSVISVSK